VVNLLSHRRRGRFRLHFQRGGHDTVDRAAAPSEARALADFVDNSSASLAPLRFLPQGRCVILLHTLPDGASHFDWLSESIAPAGNQASGGVAQASDDERSLIAFRASQSVAALQPGQSLLVDQLPNHRRLYLDFEGPISGDRGSVRRVNTGVVEHAAAEAGTDRLRIRWHHRSNKGIIQSLEIRKQTTGHWLARCETCVPASE